MSGKRKKNSKQISRTSRHWQEIQRPTEHETPQYALLTAGHNGTFRKCQCGFGGWPFLTVTSYSIPILKSVLFCHGQPKTFHKSKKILILKFNRLPPIQPKSIQLPLKKPRKVSFKQAALQQRELSSSCEKSQNCLDSAKLFGRGDYWRKCKLWS